MKKARKIEEQENTERWVVSYADFITLLFAFFTAMYAISQVDLGKLERFSGSLKTAFKASDSGSSNALDLSPIQYDYMQIEKDIRSTLEPFLDLGGISIVRVEKGIKVSFGDSLLFQTGSADVRDEAKGMLSAIASIIKRSDYNVIIEGHTDNMPIKSSRYASNWELSTARASSVLMYFINEERIHPARFSVAGYGEYRPIESNISPEGRSKNRRVDIIFHR